VTPEEERQLREMRWRRTQRRHGRRRRRALAKTQAELRRSNLQALGVTGFDAVDAMAMAFGLKPVDRLGERLVESLELRGEVDPIAETAIADQVSLHRDEGPDLHDWVRYRR
jgi:hypothetical protein